MESLSTLKNFLWSYGVTIEKSATDKSPYNPLKVVLFTLWYNRELF